MVEILNEERKSLSELYMEIDSIVILLTGLEEKKEPQELKEDCLIDTVKNNLIITHEIIDKVKSIKDILRGNK